jgi:hypothetical protein
LEVEQILEIIARRGLRGRDVCIGGIVCVLGRQRRNCQQQSKRGLHEALLEVAHYRMPPRMRIENWSDEFVNSQLLRLRAIALALRVPILNSNPRGNAPG